VTTTPFLKASPHVDFPVLDIVIPVLWKLKWNHIITLQRNLLKNESVYRKKNMFVRTDFHFNLLLRNYQCCRRHVMTNDIHITRLSNIAINMMLIV
jgi:hypothetical protein